MKVLLKWLSPLFVLSFLFAMGSYTACSSGDDSCFEDYNCPKGQFCVARKCQSTPPPGYKEPTKEPVKEPVQDAGVPEPVIEKKHDGSCSNQDDCNGNAPFCRFKRCSQGYAWFDFTSGIPLVDRAKEAARQCSNSSQCQPWQTCYQSVCRVYKGLKVTAKGKVMEEGIFLQGRGYTEEVTIDGKAYFRFVMAGDLSDKLQRHLYIEIPKSKAKNGLTFDLAKEKDIMVKLYDVHIEFVPPTKTLIATGAGGKVKLIGVSYRLGDNLTGTADLVFKKH